jgi:hypothetical protein
MKPWILRKQKAGDGAPREPRKGAARKALLIFAALLAVTGLVVYFIEHQRREQQRRETAWEQDWTTLQKGLPPSGGKPFAKRLVIPVPVFAQSDPRWGEDALGPSSEDTLSSAGCAVASAAMILASYGVDTDPQRLNDFLKANSGFTPQAWLRWEVAAQLSPEKVRFVYEHDPSFELIDKNLEKGNPVIVRLRYPHGITHFVVVCGKDGSDYLIVDPGRRSKDGVYPLKEFGSKIEALRFYEPVKS